MLNCFINYTLRVIILLSIFIFNTAHYSNTAYSKDDINKVIVEQLHETINWDNPQFYAEAQQNLARAKEIKKDAKRRQTLKKAGLSNAEIKRIMREEKQASLTSNATKNKNTKIKNTNNDDDEDDEDNSNTENNNLSHQKTNGKSYDFFVSKQNNKNQKLVYQNNNDEDTMQTSIEQQKLITNNYNTYNTYNTYNNSNNDDRKNIIPDAPVLPSGKYVALETDEDYAIQVLAKKAGRNINNKENFKMFAKELSRVANQPVNIKKTNKEILEEAELIARKQQIEQQLNTYYQQQQIMNNDYYDNNTLYTYNANTNKKKDKKVNIAKQYAMATNKIGNSQNKPVKYYATAQQTNHKQKVKTNKYNKQKYNANIYASANTSSRFYASALPTMDSPLNKISNNNSSKPPLSTMKKEEETKKKNYNNENQQDFMDIEESDKTSSIVGKTYLTEGQIKAKNLGAPTPILRNKKIKREQIMPPNISQASSYDKNNKHLQPVIFEDKIVEDVLNSLTEKNAIEIVRALINKVGKTDITDAYGNTILMHAVALKNQSLIAMLLAEGANPNATNNEGFSPLHLASTNGDNNAVYHLMMSGGDPNMRDQDGNSSLMYAAMACNLDTIKLMLSMGGDLYAKNTLNNKTLVDYAKFNNNDEVEKFITKQNNPILRKRSSYDLI